MIFLIAIEKMDRESILDLLTFLEGPGVTSYMTESLNKFMNVLPKGISNLMPSKTIQQDLDEKRLEFNDYTDKRLQKNLSVDVAEVDAAIRMAENLHKINGDASSGKTKEISIRTPKRHLTGRSPCQVTYIKALAAKQMIFGIGPAGTGKTYLAVATAA